MGRRNTLVFMVVLVIFILSLLITFPLEKGNLGGWGIRLGLDLQGGTRILYQADLSGIPSSEGTNAIDGTIAVLENRINPLGVSESSIRRLGSDQILVEIPGRSLTDAEKESLSRVAVLEFAELAAEGEASKWENEMGRWKPATATIGCAEKELTSKYFKENTFVSPADLGGIELHFEWDKEGSQISEEVTQRLIGQPLAIFEGSQALLGESGRPIAPTVQAVITSRGIITGLSLGDAERLSRQLNAGRLPVPLQRTGDEKNVEPWLGADFVAKSVKAGIIGLLVTMLFMTIYYRLSGLMTSLALVYYTVLTLAIFKLVGVIFGGGFTLTLAGVGGFILSVGMAIDANVLIFERMKEEMWSGLGLGSALATGFSRAWPAILDSNVTTILAGLVLLWLGSSNIVASDMAKGFAVTLVIGVLVSMFTAITVTRTLLRLFVGTGLARHRSLFAPYQRKANV